MNAQQSKMVLTHKVEEFYWGGLDVVYIDHRLSKASYGYITTDTIENVILNDKKD